MTAVLTAFLLPAAPAGAGHREDHPSPLRVTGAVVDVDRGLVLVTLRCVGTRARCAGSLTARAAGEDITRPRRVRLVPGRRQRVTLRVRPGGLAQRENSLGVEDAIVLRRGASTIADIVEFVPRLGCGSGATLGVTSAIRVFAVPGFGLYACARPAGRPLALARVPDEDWLSQSGPVTSGRYVAFERSVSSSHCTLREIVVVDVPGRRVVRRRRTTEYVPARDFCSGPGARAILLRPSGAVAWAEPPADGTNALIRAVDDRGERVLARGPAIDPASLMTIDEGTVGWLEAGQRRSAPLR